MKLKLFIVMAMTLFCAHSFSSPATLVKNINLSELVSESSQIVKVKVIRKDIVDDQDESGRLVSYYTFQVLERLKGTPEGLENELVIKQIAQGSYTLNGHSIRQFYYFPEYEIGKTYLLFLPDAHEVTGLLAPLGLQQGVFEIRDDNGSESIPHLKTRWQGLTRHLSTKSKTRLLQATASTSGKAPKNYNELSKIIRSLLTQP